MEEHPRRPPIEGRRDRPSASAASFAAALAAFHARLCASDSATETLRSHCAELGIEADPVITARRNECEARPPSAEQRMRLQLGEAEVVRYRSVRLMCGEIALCDAEIWYVPARLPTEVNRALEASQVPFGRLVAPFAPKRLNISSRVIEPERRTGAHRRPGADHAIEHRALVMDRHGTALAEVHELYRRALFATAAQPSGGPT